jgi:putative endonuclease
MLARWSRFFRTALPLGARGEALATRFLKRKGYKIVARSHRSPLGELDIVAVDKRDPRGPTVVFVEVKTRASHDAGHPAEAIDGEKQRRITQLARGYRRRFRLTKHPARFDVVAITWSESPQKPQIDHYVDAFESFDAETLD